MSLVALPSDWKQEDIDAFGKILWEKARPLGLFPSEYMRLPRGRKLLMDFIEKRKI